MASEWCRASLGWSYADAVLALSVAAPVMALFLHATGQRLLPGAARAAVALPCVLLNLLLAKLFCRWTDINTTILIR